MNQNIEHIFFNENGIYISQFRFVTPNGRTYPAKTMQQVYPSQDRPWGAGLHSIWVGLIFAMLWAYGAGGTCISVFAIRDGEDWIGLLLGSFALFIICTLWFLVGMFRRRRRYFANFMFAGGGDFSTVGGFSASGGGVDYGGGAVFGGGGSFSSSTTRKPDYSTWSYDRQWTERLVAAANEAMIAAQQT